MVPGQGTKTLRAARQLSLMPQLESTCSRAPGPEKPTHRDEQPMQSKKKDLMHLDSPTPGISQIRAAHTLSEKGSLVGLGAPA